MDNMKILIDKLARAHTLSKDEWVQLIRGRTKENSEYLFLLARKFREKYYGHDIYIRGLIEYDRRRAQSVGVIVAGDQYFFMALARSVQAF